MAHKVVTEYKDDVKKLLGREVPTVPVVQNWSAPHHKTFKINWDVAIEKVHCKVGVGVIV